MDTQYNHYCVTVNYINMQCYIQAGPMKIQHCIFIGPELLTARQSGENVSYASAIRWRFQAASDWLFGLGCSSQSLMGRLSSGRNGSRHRKHFEHLFQLYQLLYSKTAYLILIWLVEFDVFRYKINHIWLYVSKTLVFLTRYRKCT